MMLPFSHRIDLENEDATIACAKRLALLVQAGDVLALVGTLGMGKSVFARAFIRACMSDSEEVPSPTFTLVQIYDGHRFSLWHFDLYRLQNADEAIELGVEEAFSEGVSLIEWPDRLGSFLPETRLEIAFSAADSPIARRLTLSGHGAWADRLQEWTRI